MNRAAKWFLVLAVVALNGAMATPMFSSASGRTTIAPIVMHDGEPIPTDPPDCKWAPDHIHTICPK